MNSPIETNAFKHYLVFESLGKTDLYEIAEPEGFDNAVFTLKQNANRFSRDLTYIASENKALTFRDTTTFEGDTEQVVNPQGKVSKYRDYGLAWILQSDKQFGFESKIKYILNKDGILFDAGYLGCAAKNTDGYTYFSCNVIQDNAIANYKKQASTKINVLGSKNFKNEPITPAPTLDFLRKALPFDNISVLTSIPGDPQYVQASQIGAIGSATVYFNKIKNIEKDGVKYTLSWLDDYIQYNYTTSAYDPPRDTFCILRAKNKSTRLTVKITLNLKLFLQSAGAFSNERSIFKLYCFSGNSGTFDSNFAGPTSSVWESVLLGTDTGVYSQDVNTVVEVPINDLNISGKIWCCFSFNGSSEYPIYAMEHIGSKIEIIATQTSLNTVIKGVRYIDMMRQSSKFINNLPVNAARFDVGGEFYDQVCWNRALVSQNTSIPFVTTYKDVMESVQEVCGDYENKLTEIFVGREIDFYENIEIGAILIRPSSEAKVNFNEKFKLKSVKLGYQKYQQDSNLDQNTKEDAHTEAEWIVPNEMATNGLDRKFSFVRSGFSQQKTVDLEISKPSTSDSTDDDVNINTITPLAPNSFDVVPAVLNQRVDALGNLQILNRSTDVDAGDVVINWTVLGISVNDTVTITEGVNLGTYSVVSLTTSLITLLPISATPTISGDHFIKLKYYYTNVYYVTKTDEGFNVVSGISTPTAYPNLDFSLRRIFDYWGSFINTACSFSQTKKITNSYFKSNGLLTTQKLITDPLLIENAEIDPTTLPQRILSVDMWDLDCVATWQEVTELLENYKTKRGFIRFYDINGKVVLGYINDLSFTFAKNDVSLKVEGKYIPEIVDVTYNAQIITVNDVPYALSGVLDWYKFENGFFQAFDDKSRPICNKTKWDKIRLNGVVYTTLEGLQVALDAL